MAKALGSGQIWEGGGSGNQGSRSQEAEVRFGGQ